MSYALRHIVAFVATGFLVAPNAMLPCFDDGCAVDGIDAPICCMDPCANSSGGTKTAAPCDDDSIPQPRERGSHPCECPPGCPAPCGTGKLPCAPVSMATLLTTNEQFTMHQPDRLAAPAFCAGDDLFRPPRS